MAINVNTTLNQRIISGHRFALNPQIGDSASFVENSINAKNFSNQFPSQNFWSGGASVMATSPFINTVFDWGEIAWDSGLLVVSGLMLLHQLIFWGNRLLKRKYLQDIPVIENDISNNGLLQDDLEMSDIKPEDQMSSFAARHVDTAYDAEALQVDRGYPDMNILDQCPNCNTSNVQNLVHCSSCRLPLIVFKDKYRFIKQIGEGGMGTIYLAEHLQLKRENKRVIKIVQIPAQSTEERKAEIIERFEREILTLHVLCKNEPHIVRIYDDFGFVKGLGNCYVMEHLEGGTLDDLISGRLQASIKRGCVPYRTLFKIVAQVCRGMQSAHEKEMVHRDLKPANIFLTQGTSSEPFFVKIIDFGITKWLGEDEENLTARSALLGTPLYMAPEQMTGGDITNKTDIYALGIIFYEMFTGKHPLLIEGLADVQGQELIYKLIMLHVDGERIPMTTRRPDLPELACIDSIIRKAMDPDPVERFATVADFFSALKEGFRKLPMNRYLEVNQNVSAKIFGAGFDKTPSIKTELARLKQDERIKLTLGQYGDVVEHGPLEKVDKTLAYSLENDDE